jgi:peptide chain release factor subunit 1
MGAVQTLIVYENLDMTRYELKNPQTEETKILFLTTEQEKDNSFLRDPETNVELEVVDKVNSVSTYNQTKSYHLPIQY